MTTLWTWADIDAPAPVLWDLLTDTDAWPRWGPTVRSATVDGDAHGSMSEGARGTVTSALGVSLPFEITRFEPGERWAWSVGGVPATDHRVEALGPSRCRVGFGVPLPTAPYLAVCRIALCRLARLADERTGTAG